MTAQSTKVDRGADTEYPLTEEQVSCMHEQGWAPLPGLLSAADATALREALLEAPPRSTFSGPDKMEADPKILQQTEGVAWHDERVRSLATSRRLSSAVVGLMALPDALFVHDLSFFKPVGAQEVPYHQDFSYWPFDRWGNLSLWIALEDISEEMGPLRYLRGSHQMGPLGLIERRDIRDAYPRLWDLEVVGGHALKAGDAQAHWELTCHGSAENAGTNRREAVAFRYHRTDVIYTGLTHPHFDTFELRPGRRILSSKKFPHIGPEGIIDD
ncbi:MAG: phytanoyl-CoA dioxygenase family protein [Microthrixaceae bacterium]